MKKIDIIVIILFSVFSLFTLRELFIPGYFTSHDGIHQVPRLYYFDQAIKDGQLPPRWAGGLMYGFGYPLYIFSYHTPWFIAEPLHLLGFSIFDSIKYTYLIGFFLSAIAMYTFQKEIFGRYAAVIGSLFYIYAPFRFSNIFVRGAIGDATIFIFPPIVLLTIVKLLKSNDLNFKWISIGGTAFALMLLSHAMVFLLYMPCIFLFILFSGIIARKKKVFLISAVLTFVIGIGLSSYYLIPSVTERSATKFSEIMSISGALNINNKFISLGRLIYSPWGYGTMDAKEGGMSFQVGITQWIIVFISFLLLIFIKNKKNKLQFFTGVFFLGSFIFTIYAMLNISLPFWRLITKITIIDFPWRIMSVTVFSSSILAGFTCFFIKNRKIRYILSVALILLLFYSNRNHLKINQTLDWPLDFYLKLEKSTNSYDEYTPKWVQDNTIKETKETVISKNSDTKISNLKKSSNLVTFNISAPLTDNVRINTIYYPGWKLYINGKAAEIKYNNGFMEFTANEGKSAVVAKFTETLIRKISDFISIMTIIILLTLNVIIKRS